MDFLNKKEVYFNKKAHDRAYFNGILIWSKVTGDFSKDFKILTDFEDWNGVYEETPSNLLTQVYSGVWGTANAIDMGEEGYKIEAKEGTVGAFGIKSSVVPMLKADVKYRLSLDINTTECEKVGYNYILSSDGNQAIGPFITPKDGVWHRYSLEITPTADRPQASILIGGDVRQDPGRSFYVRNLVLEECNAGPIGGRFII